MNAKDLIQLRLSNQGLLSAQFNTCADVVSHFGVMQSQDYSMTKWAVALRMKKASDSEIEHSFNEGQILRTHILRPTWHFVHREDIRWMMELSAPYVKKATQYVDKQVGLTDEVFKKAWKIIDLELERKDNLTKEDVMDVLAKKKMPVENLLATQILIRSELELRICSGPKKGKKVTYSLFDKRVRSSEKISKKDALVKLASLYFRSRGPATVKDFTWWSGLNVMDAKFAVSGLGESLNCASIGGLYYFYFKNVDYSKNKASALLPTYDEYMVGYSEGRNIALPKDIDKSLVGNGIFKPIALADNVVVGTWKEIKKEPFVEIRFIQGKKHTFPKSKLEDLKLFLKKQEK